MELNNEDEKQKELVSMVVGYYITLEVDDITWGNYWQKLDKEWFQNVGLKLVANEKMCQMLIDLISKSHRNALQFLNPMEIDSKHQLPIVQVQEALLNHLKLFAINWAKPGYLPEAFRFYFEFEKCLIKNSFNALMLQKLIATGQCSPQTFLILMDYCTLKRLFISKNDFNYQSSFTNIVEESASQIHNYKYHNIVKKELENSKQHMNEHGRLEDFADKFVFIFIEIIFVLIENIQLINCDSILAIERFVLVKNLESAQRIKLLANFNKLIKSIVPEEKLDISKMSNEKYQVAFCIRWLLDNVLNDDAKKLKILAPIKLLPNEMSARNDTANMTTVRSAFAVTSGVFYYEAVILTNGKIQIGWTTRESIVDVNGFIGDEKSVGVLIPERKEESQVVFGFLINVNEQKFIIYKNGVNDDECKSEVNLKMQSYFAAASLSAHQQIYFNFGQIPFKFTLENIQFQTFHQASGKNLEKYRLLAPQKDEWYHDYWFKQEVFEDTKIEPLYRDALQKSYENQIDKYEQNFLNDYTIKEFDSNLANNNRLIQAIVDVTGEKLSENNKISYLANFIGDLIHRTDLSLYAGTFYNLIYPYLKWKVTEKNKIKHRNVCLVLLSIIQRCKHSKFMAIHPIRQEVFAYLVNSLKNENSDQWTQLYTIVCLENLELTEKEKDIIQKDNEINELFEWIDQHFNSENIYKMLQSNEFELYNYQLYFCNEYFETNCLGKSDAQSKNKGPKLDFTNKSVHLKLSQNGLSPRSDWQWQSVRSECKTNVETTSVIYFEVILFTSGPMRIGWATEHTYLHKDVVIGSDEQSIGFDGFNRCVWNGSKSYPIVNAENRWKAGDVVGCLIDVPKKQFHFFLNGQQLQYPQKDLFFSTLQPYFAAITLAQHQHCLFNFGDEKFMFPPKQYDFNSFSLKQTFNQLKITGSHLTNTNIFVNSSVQCGNIEQKYNSS